MTWTAGTTGAVTARADYDPYGNLVSSSGTTPASRWQGSYYDGSSGFYYVEARWYSPTLGEYLSEDPISHAATDPQDRDLYAYGAGDPLSGTDPSGMSINLGAVASFAWKHYKDASLPVVGMDFGGLTRGYPEQCTDFASMALLAGGRVQNRPHGLSGLLSTAVSQLGVPFVGEFLALKTLYDAYSLNNRYKSLPYYWYYLAPGFSSYSWGGAYDLYRNLLIRGGKLVNGRTPWHLNVPDKDHLGDYKVPAGIRAGDIIFVSWSGPDPRQIAHTGVVIEVPNPGSPFKAGLQVLIAQHDANKIDSLWDWQVTGNGSNPINSSSYVWVVEPRR